MACNHPSPAMRCISAWSDSSESLPNSAVSDTAATPPASSSVQDDPIEVSSAPPRPSSPYRPFPTMQEICRRYGHPYPLPDPEDRCPFNNYYASSDIEVGSVISLYGNDSINFPPPFTAISCWDVASEMSTPPRVESPIPEPGEDGWQVAAVVANSNQSADSQSRRGSTTSRFARRASTAAQGVFRRVSVSVGKGLRKMSLVGKRKDSGISLGEGPGGEYEILGREIEEEDGGELRRMRESHFRAPDPLAEAMFRNM